MEIILKVEFSCGRKAERYEGQAGKRPPQGAGLRSIQKRSVRLKIKNEPVVGRNIFHRARPCKGAKLTPWLWAGGRKEVRTLQKCG